MKPRYYLWEAAPMKFYHVFCILLTIGTLFGTFRFFDSFSSFAAIRSSVGIFLAVFDVLFRLSILALRYLSLAFLREKRWHGVLFFYISFWMSVAYMAFADYLGSSSISLLGRLTGSALAFFPIYIYFAKRRPLFSPWHAAIPAEQYVQQEARMKHLIVDESTGEVISETTIPAPSGEPEPIVCTYQSDFKIPTPQQEETPLLPSPAPGTRKWKIACAALAIVCAISLAGNVLQLTQARENAEALASTESAADRLHNQVRVFSQDLSNVRKELAFFTGEIGFVFSGSNLYHHYYCPIAEENLKLGTAYSALDCDSCKAIGCTRCQLCWGYW